ncbi:DUF2642 domain-containing protein [Bacillus sp. SD075]|uniref:DUF2642 domain-containing protein n=1 Tax=Bacillus sp. SD075 TaxID=2781732 RepID=UPI001A959EAB|nr:DUF2642 domain-containing protein [Bacillus sp. SD075]MBO0997561.1 DUF2642 domain-containing protein [Bacillus sp. SD075]
MQSFPYEPYRETLPPGQYAYTSGFPAMMRNLSPTYTIPTEPVFLDHLLMNLEKTIIVVTTNGTLEGKLTGVAIDHIQLTVRNLNHHIRYQHIVYYSGKP